MLETSLLGKDMSENSLFGHTFEEVRYEYPHF